MEATIESLGILVHAVPLARLKPLLPDREAADPPPTETSASPDRAQALVATVAAHLRLETAPVKIRVQTIQLQALAHHGDRPVCHVIRTILHPGLPARLAHLFVPSLSPGRADPSYSGVETGWALDGPSGRLELELKRASNSLTGEPPPALLGRSAFTFWMRGGWLCKLPFRVIRMVTQPAEVVRLRVPDWHELGVLTTSEIRSPLYTFLSDPCRVQLAWPRPDIMI